MDDVANFVAVDTRCRRVELCRTDEPAGGVLPDPQGASFRRPESDVGVKRCEPIEIIERLTDRRGEGKFCRLFQFVDDQWSEGYRRT